MLIDCGLPAALSVTLSEAAAVDPACVGLKATLMLQFAPAAKFGPQLVV
jgi:hypothetical protein